MYSLLVLVLIGVSAFVVDISMLRESRRMTRSAADSAALAAASKLNVLDPTKSAPRDACNKAWNYLALSLPGLRASDGAASCNNLPVSGSSCTTSTPPVTYPYVASGQYFVRIIWPVPTGNALLTQPDIAPNAAPSQAENTQFDGDTSELCARIGVEVIRQNRFTLAAAMGFSGQTTRAASVGRGVVEGFTKEVVAALNILEPRRCDAIVTQGQGSVTVQGAGQNAGVIAVESSGRDNGAGRCPNNRPYVIDPLSNPNNFIHVLGAGGVGQGILFSYALVGPTLGNPADAYNPARVTDGVISPKPVLLSEVFGARPVTDIFDCTAARACTKTPAPWITDLVTAYGGSGAPTAGYAGGPPGYTGSTFTTLPGAAVPTFKCNTQPSDPTVVVPAGNWFINCNTLSIANTLIFQGGVIVTKGDVEAGSSSACIAVNVPATTCPSINTTAVPATTTPAPTGDAILYIRSGRLYKVSQAQLYMPQTFTYITNAGNGSYVDLGGGSGSLLWTNPIGTDCAILTPPADQQCRDKRFVRMTLWSESSADHGMGGQTGLRLRGVLFTPNAQFTYDGQGTQNQTDAQFWTKLLVVKGQAGLTMVADPDASVSRPSLGVSLIR
jgi:hypothetical protein